MTSPLSPAKGRGSHEWHRVRMPLVLRALPVDDVLRRELLHKRWLGLVT